MFRTLFLAAVAAALTLSAADMLSGTWKVNSAKSKWDPPNTAKVVAQKVSMDGDWVVSTSDTTTADGKAATSTVRYKFDGKEYPYKTAIADGTISAKKIDDRHTELMIKGGKTSLTVKNVISADGKTRTATVTGTDNQGRAANSVVVFEKQ